MDTLSLSFNALLNFLDPVGPEIYTACDLFTIGHDSFLHNFCGILSLSTREILAGTCPILQSKQDVKEAPDFNSSAVNWQPGCFQFKCLDNLACHHNTVNYQSPDSNSVLSNSRSESHPVSGANS